MPTEFSKARNQILIVFDDDRDVQEVSEVSDSLIELYEAIFQEAIKKSRNITSDPFQIMKMSAKDFEKLNEIEKCIQVISKTLENLRSE